MLTAGSHSRKPRPVSAPLRSLKLCTAAAAATLVIASLLPADADAASRHRRGDTPTNSLDAGGAGFPGAAMMAAQGRGEGHKALGGRARDRANLARSLAGRADGSGSQAAMLNMRATHMRWSAAAVRGALHDPQIHQALHSTQALQDPKTRALVTATLATVAWHRGGHGWWRHGNGGYGWVGPVFWPFAFYDISNAALWGNDTDPTFWSYGYPDLHAALFGPYAYDDLTGYATHLRAARNVSGAAEAATAAGIDKDDQNSLAQLCGDASRSIAGLPVDTIAQAIQPSEQQRTALDGLADASAKASLILQAACPTDMVLTAPRRLAIMQSRLEAMISAVQTLQPALDAFYGPLSEQQKLQFDGIAAAQRAASDKALAASRTPQAVTQVNAPVNAQATPQTTAQPPGDPATVANCATARPDSGVTAWPAAMITQAVAPTDTQRDKFTALQNATTKAADMLATTCAGNAATPPARLAAIGQRLDTMLQAVTTVHAALDDVYATLNEEQKVSFDTVGAQQLVAALPPPTGRRGRAAQPDSAQLAAPPPVAQADTTRETRPTGRRYARYARHHGRHGVHVARVLRRMLFSFVR